MIGSVNGCFKPLLEKLTKLQSKTPFSFAIAAGDFFADPSKESTENDKSLAELLNSKIAVPLPIYFGIGQHALPQAVMDRLKTTDNGEVCENLYFLGKRSTTKTSEGLRIVSLGGVLDPAIAVGQSKDKYLPFHAEGDARTLYGANRADILLTSTWPASVQTGSKAASPVEPLPTEEQCIADLCARLKPRYHFSSTAEAFYEREPFYHKPDESAPEERLLTRFISLASSTATSKAKWLYAFSIEPNATPSTNVPPGTTASPFAIKQKRRAPDTQGYARFSNEKGSHNSHRNKRQRNQPPPGPGECFFCMSNPDLATQLITSIGTETYLTTAKGPLTAATTFPDLKTPGHILLIPLSHSSSLAAISETSARQSTYSELQRYRTALNAMLTTQAGNKLGSVTWEIVRGRIVHFHWQYLPVPISLIEKGLVEAAFQAQAENNKYPSIQRRDIGDGVGQGEYFRVWIWSPASDMVSDKDLKGKDKGLQLVIPLNPDVRFDVQFGRRVMGQLLGLDDRVDWKDCLQSDAEETAEAERFKELFKLHDFSLKE